MRRSEKQLGHPSPLGIKLVHRQANAERTDGVQNIWFVIEQLVQRFASRHRGSRSSAGECKGPVKVSRCYSAKSVRDESA